MNDAISVIGLLLSFIAIPLSLLVDWILHRAGKRDMDRLSNRVDTQLAIALRTQQGAKLHSLQRNADGTVIPNFTMGFERGHLEVRGKPIAMN